MYSTVNIDYIFIRTNLVFFNLMCTHDNMVLFKTNRYFNSVQLSRRRARFGISVLPHGVVLVRSVSRETLGSFACVAQHRHHTLVATAHLTSPNVTSCQLGIVNRLYFATVLVLRTC